MQRRPHISQDSGTMKEITLRIGDADYKYFMGLMKLCPRIEVVCTSETTLTSETAGQGVFAAISRLREDKVFRYPSDYTYIMIALNEAPVKGVPFFYSPKEFIDYLKALGFDALPGRSTIYDCKVKMDGRYPEWEFNDKPHPVEKMRRINVAKRFLHAFNSAVSQQSDGLSD